MARPVGWQHPGVPKAKVSPNTRDLEWAAGFLEGERHFGGYPSSAGRYGERVMAGQVNKEPLLRLQRLFGGPVFHIQPKLRNASPQWRWVIYGARARGVMMSLFSLLSQDKRTDIKLALAKERAA